MTSERADPGPPPPAVVAVRLLSSYLCYGLILAGVIAAVLAFQYLGLGSARRAAIVPRADGFTELYFIHPESLPYVVAPGRALRFEFVIDNREGRRFGYHWAASLAADGGRSQLVSGAVTLKNGGSARVPVVVQMPYFTGFGKVAVHLRAPDQAINFHVRAS